MTRTWVRTVATLGIVCVGPVSLAKALEHAPAIPVAIVVHTTLQASVEPLGMMPYSVPNITPEGNVTDE